MGEEGRNRFTIISLQAVATIAVVEDVDIIDVEREVLLLTVDVHLIGDEASDRLLEDILVDRLVGDVDDGRARTEVFDLHSLLIEITEGLSDSLLLSHRTRSHVGLSAFGDLVLNIHRVGADVIGATVLAEKLLAHTTKGSTSAGLCFIGCDEGFVLTIASSFECIDQREEGVGLFRVLTHVGPTNARGVLGVCVEIVGPLQIGRDLAFQQSVGDGAIESA